jgi:hypothetical protein
MSSKFKQFENILREASTSDKSSTDTPNYAMLEGQVLKISLKPEKKENIFLTARNFHKETDEFLSK